MSAQGWSLVIAAVGITGTLAGALVNSFLGRHNQRAQWMLDNRRGEWKELINAIDTTFTQYIEYKNTGLKGPEDRMRLQEAERRFLVTVRDRLFIADEVKELKVYERFIKSIRRFETEWGVQEFSKEYSAVKKDVLEAARKSI